MNLLISDRENKKLTLSCLFLRTAIAIYGEEDGESLASMPWVIYAEELKAPRFSIFFKHVPTPPVK